MKITKKDNNSDYKLREINTGEVYYDPTSDFYNIKTKEINVVTKHILTVNLATGEAFYKGANSPAQKVEAELIVSVKKHQ